MVIIPPISHSLLACLPDYLFACLRICLSTWASSRLFALFVRLFVCDKFICLLVCASIVSSCLCDSSFKCFFVCRPVYEPSSLVFVSAFSLMFSRLFGLLADLPTCLSVCLSASLHICLFQSHVIL